MMRKLLLIGVVAGVIAVVVLASSNYARVQRAEDEPQLWIDNWKQDFGIMTPGSILSCRFKLRNQGAGMLHVTHVDTSCGCTAAKLSASQLGPAESAVLSLTIKTPLATKDVSHMVSFRTNDQRHKYVELRIQGKSRWPIECDVGTLHFGSLRPDQLSTRTVEVISRTGTPFRVVDVVASAGWIAVDALDSANHPGRHRYEITIQQRQVGLYSENVRFFTDCEERREIVVPVTLEIATPALVSPRQIVMGTLVPGQTKDIRLLVDAHAEQPVALEQIRVVDNGAADSKQTWQIVSAQGESLESAAQRSVIKLRLRVPDQTGYFRGVIQIPVGDDQANVSLSAYVRESQ